MSKFIFGAIFIFITFSWATMLYSTKSLSMTLVLLTIFAICLIFALFEIYVRGYEDEEIDYEN